MSTKYDFKEHADALFKKILKGQTLTMTPEFARMVVEVALREAYSRGMQEAKGHVVVAKSAPASASKSAPRSTPQSAKDTCAHDWEETFLDGRTVGIQCVHCGILQKDVQESCQHFFVKTGNIEVCVACRRSKKA